jgi:hypothetical protein
VGTLETWRNKLVKADTAVANQFVTEVDIANDGTVTIGRAQPTSDDVKHGTSSTVSAVLVAHAAEVAKLSDIGSTTKVGATIDSKISAALGNLDVTAPTVPTSGTTTSLEFIDTVSQTDGKISASKKKLPDASTGVKGVVQLSNATNSSSETEAATPKAVKAAYDVGSSAASRVGTVEGNYVRFNDNKLYVGKDGTDGTDYIIFDCGGAV